MKMKEMTASELIYKFRITLEDDSHIRVPAKLYPAALNILKQRKNEILAVLHELKEEGHWV